jgi:hypothetical protein
MEVPAGLDDWIERAGASFHEDWLLCIMGMGDLGVFFFLTVFGGCLYISISPLDIEWRCIVTEMEFYALVLFFQASRANARAAEIPSR